MTMKEVHRGEATVTTPMTMTEIHDALTKHLIDVWGELPSIAPRHAANMIRSWDYLTDKDVDGETGRRTCDQ
jgi:hypothetical protein